MLIDTLHAALEDAADLLSPHHPGAVDCADDGQDLPRGRRAPRTAQPYAIELELRNSMALWKSVALPI